MEVEKMKRKTIRRLKEIKAEQQLSYTQIMKMLEDAGQYVSEATLKKVFADGSEEKSFRYHDTIMPIADVLLDLYGDRSGLEDVESLREIIREKNKFIDSILIKLDDQKEDYKEKEKLYNERKEVYEDMIASLKDHLARCEKAIERKDAMIERLLNATLQEKSCENDCLT